MADGSECVGVWRMVEVMVVVVAVVIVVLVEQRITGV